MTQDLRTFDLIFGIVTFLILSLYVSYRYESYTFGNADPGWMMLATQSLVEDFDLDLKNQLHDDPREASDQISLGVRGEWYPLHEWFISLLGIPFYILFSWDGLLLLNVLLSFGIVLLMYEHIKLYQTHFMSALICLLTLVSSSLLYYSYSFSIDILGCFFFMLTVVAMIRKKIMLSGLSFSLTVLSRNFYLFTVLAFILYLYINEKRDSKKFINAVISFCIGGIPVLLLFFSSNFYMYGDALSTSYLHWYAYDESVHQIIKKSHTFDKPFFPSLKSLFLSFQNSIWRTSPFFIIGIFWGISHALTKSLEIIALYVTVFLILTILVACHQNSFPGEVGNRYFLILVPLTAFLLSHINQKATC